jgi:hypothetical protein
MFRSAGAKRQALVRAAFLSPDLFATGVVRAHLFPLRPRTPGSWHALLAVSFPVPLAASGGDGKVERDFGCVLNRGSVLVHSFNRRVTLRHESAGTGAEPLVTFLEPVDLEPGKYLLTAVMLDPATAGPHTAKLEVEIGEVPRKALFLVDPVLGRRAGADVVVSGSGAQPKTGDSKSKKKKDEQKETEEPDRVGTENSFQPLLVRSIERPEELLVLSQACIVGSAKRSEREIMRALRTSAGQRLGELPPVALHVEGEGKIRCQSLMDILPGASLDEGEYVFEAYLGPTPPEGMPGVRFAIDSPEAD